MKEVIEKSLEFFNQGGFIMFPLVIMTMVLWYTIGYRFLLLHFEPVGKLKILLDNFKNAPKRLPENVIESAIKTGIELKSKNLNYLRSNLDEKFRPLEQSLNSLGSLLNSIVIIAPLCGLLGTVSGMIETFDSLASMTLFSQSGGVAGGISQALFTTQMGLTIAIPGLFIGKILSQKQELIEIELVKLKDILCGEEKEIQS